MIDTCEWLACVCAGLAGFLLRVIVYVQQRERQVLGE